MQEWQLLSYELQATSYGTMTTPALPQPLPPPPFLLCLPGCFYGPPCHCSAFTSMQCDVPQFEAQGCMVTQLTNMDSLPWLIRQIVCGFRSLQGWLDRPRSLVEVLTSSAHKHWDFGTTDHTSHPSEAR